MIGKNIRQHFQVMGADIDISARGEGFEIGIEQGPYGETFRVRLPADGSIQAKVADSDRNRRHVLLDVEHRSARLKQQYLCGHDESHWFVAALPEKSAATTLFDAMESLKPQAVQQEQRRKRVRRSRQGNRHTMAYVRQGEWFFVPRLDFDAADLIVQSQGKLVRGNGKPHHVQWLCRNRDGATFVRGNVSHPDHATIRLELWHEVFRNTEALPRDLAAEHRREQLAAEQRRAVFEMSYLD